MSRTTLIAIAVASALLAPAVVEAAGPAQPAKPVVVAEAAIKATVTREPDIAPAPDGCTRRVRVVYAAAYQVPQGECAAPGAAK